MEITPENTLVVEVYSVSLRIPNALKIVGAVPVIEI